MTITEEKPKIETFTAFLESVKIQRGFSYTYQLAELLGVATYDLSRIISGKKAPNANHIEIILANLNYVENSPEYFELLKLAHKANLSQAATDQRKRKK